MSRIQNTGGDLQCRVLHLMVESRKQIQIIQKIICFEHSKFGHLRLLRVDPFGMLRPDFACLRRSGYAQAGASDLNPLGR
jgi:hypothetical protein